MDILGNFYRDSALRETVKKFFIDTLADMAVEKTFNGESVSGIKDAKELIEKAFENLEETYGNIEKPVIPNSR